MPTDYERGHADALAHVLYAGLAGRAGRDVHEAWRAGMLEQGREVSDERMHWDTLPARDRRLDESIAEYVVRRVVRRVLEERP